MEGEINYIRNTAANYFFAQGSADAYVDGEETEITLITLTASAFQGVGSFYCSPVAFKWCFPCDEEPEVNRVEGNLCEAGYWYSGELKLPMV